MRLTDHSVLITGGSAGIGLALAREPLGRGNRDMVCGRDPERLAAARAALPGLHFFPADISRDEDLRGLVAVAEAEMGGLSVLVNNAGVQRPHNFLADDPETVLLDAHRKIATNLIGLITLTAFALPLLRRWPEAAVLNISSGLALVPKRSAPVYCATKAAVHAFSTALRYQTERDAPNVSVLEAILPIVDTEMTRGRGNRKTSPERVATEIARGMAAGRGEIHVGLVKVLVPLNRAAPSLAARIMRDG